jgi:hypothetical protein
MENWPPQLANNSITRWGNYTLSREDENPNRKNLCLFTMKQKMINEFSALFTHATPFFLDYPRSRFSRTLLSKQKKKPF